MKTNTYQVVVVGGGSVGLYLGCLLHDAGISCLVLEKRSEPTQHSRSIGIHPPCLELFADLGIADALMERGVKVKQGLAFIDSDAIGTLSFASCASSYPFILTLPQHQTEQLIENHLHTLNPAMLQRNAEVSKLQEMENAVRLTVQIDGSPETISAKYVVGCDGINSTVRLAAQIGFSGKTYDDSYIMGDFADNTAFGPDAAVFLCREGLIESFPLPDTMRRWVIKTDRAFPVVTRQDIESRVAERIGHSLQGIPNSMLSSFTAQKRLADTMSRRHILLAGDAAHIVSPIGGQGMNLGWMDAYDLCNCLTKALKNESQAASILHQYSTRRLKIARKALRRAEFNMILGRKTRSWRLKKGLVCALLKPPASQWMTRLFTMRGL